MPFQPAYKVPQDRQAYTIVGSDSEWQEEYGRIGCLMLHGFMGSPVSSRDMALFLAENGITVHCPLLPGHGNLPEKLHKHTLREWKNEVNEAFSTLHEMADTIFVIGHSMGAILAANLTQQYKNIQGLIMLAPLYDVPDQRIKWAGVGRFFVPWFYPLTRENLDHEPFLGRVTDFDPTVNIHDPSMREWLIQATRMPLSAVWQMVKTANLGRRLWPQIKVPALVLQGEADPAVSLESAHLIYSLLPNDNKKLEIFPETGHELMRTFEPVHHHVWQLILEFIEENTAVSIQSYS